VRPPLRVRVRVRVRARVCACKTVGEGSRGICHSPLPPAIGTLWITPDGDATLLTADFRGADLRFAALDGTPHTKVLAARGDPDFLTLTCPGPPLHHTTIRVVAELRTPGVAALTPGKPPLF